MENKAQDDDLVMNLVELALGQPEPERRAYLQRACAGETELFEQAWEYVQWESRMQGFLLEPLYSPPLHEHPFEPGELLDGRFRILREIAQGGMGVVYEAMDERLERRIAIKCAKTGFRKRLPPEVRHAREITHPNVCKIFEIHTARTQAGEIDFVTMEYLEGETLADCLKRGPVPEAEARAIARQLCSGLAEAHSKGVIHGDLKSNNVILTKAADASTRSVITDFGMSRATEVFQSTMQSGPRGGTPDYMAPELLQGEKASVASDVYALGVMLHELVSGRKPAAGAGIAVHPKWNPIVAKCLAADPKNRYANATQIAQAFEPPRTRRWFLAAAAAGVLAVISAVVTYQRTIAPRETVRLAVLPFATTADLAPIADSLLRDAMAQIGRLRSSPRTKLGLLPLSSILYYKVSEPEKARAVLDATHVMHGTLEKQDDNLTIHVYVTDLRSGVNAKEWKAQYKRGDLRYAPVALAGMVSGTFHLPAFAVGSVVDPAAQKDYWAGLYYLGRDTEIDSALASLERAVVIDPGSALAYAGLAEAQWQKYFLTKDPQFLERSEESLRQAEYRNPDSARVHYVSGILKANAGWYEQATVEYLRTIELEPKFSSAHRRLGQTYGRNSQFEQALEAFHKSIEADARDYKNYQALGALYYERADYREAADHLKKAVELAPDQPNARYALASAYIALGRFAEGENQLRVAASIKETAPVLHTLGLALMYQGREQEATPYFLHALNLSPPEKYLSWMYLGICYRRLDLPREAERAYHRGLELAEREMAQNPRRGYIRSYLGYFNAALGNRRRAESETAQALQLSPEDANTRWNAALAYERLDRRESTLAVLGNSPAQLLADLNRWPDVADLRRDSRFLQLLISNHVQ